ncbi:MAG: 2'-5' RNA ligase family protein [Streptosporangiaceae bacterium]|nr:2'-5' RNA ligase family protein [Streptosporangiaceae bacterium]
MTALMIWLAPAAGPGRDEVAAVIDRLAAEQGGPRFAPHVTVAAGSEAGEHEATRALTSLVADLPPFDVSFSGFGYEQEYFRALYLRAEPSAQLGALREAALRAWALPQAPYLPHLSLLYSGVGTERKRAILGDVGITLPLTLLFDAVELWADPGQGVSGWRRVARVPLPSRLSQPPATVPGPGKGMARPAASRQVSSSGAT